WSSLVCRHRIRLFSCAALLMAADSAHASVPEQREAGEGMRGRSAVATSRDIASFSDLARQQEQHPGVPATRRDLRAPTRRHPRSFSVGKGTLPIETTKALIANSPAAPLAAQSPLVPSPPVSASFAALGDNVAACRPDSQGV